MTKPPNSGGLVFLAVVLGLNLLLLLLLRGGAELRQRLGTDPRASARPPPCSIGYPAHRGLQTSAPSLGTGVRATDTLLPYSPRSRSSFISQMTNAATGVRFQPETCR